MSHLDQLQRLQDIHRSLPLPTPAHSPTTAIASPTNEADTSHLGKDNPRKRNQVKRACVNCQKACKKCDNGRPCSRCIKFGLETSCEDSQRKERQRVGVKRGQYKAGREDSADSASEEAGGKGFNAAAWTKLDILSRLCHSVLMHNRDGPDEEAPATDSSAEDPEILAAKSLSIIANRSRGVSEDELMFPASPDASPDPDHYEYDHQSFDHLDLVSEAGGRLKAALAVITLNGLAATPLAGPGLYSPLYPLGSYSGSTPYAKGTIGGDTTPLAGAEKGQSVGRYGPFTFSNFVAAPPTAPSAPQARAPNPLDDFAAISDTVRRMESEANARSKKRKAPSALGSVRNTPHPRLSIYQPASSVIKRTRLPSIGGPITPAPTRGPTPSDTPGQTPDATPSQTPSQTPLKSVPSRHLSAPKQPSGRTKTKSGIIPTIPMDMAVPVNIYGSSGDLYQDTFSYTLPADQRLPNFSQFDALGSAPPIYNPSNSYENSSPFSTSGSTGQESTFVHPGMNMGSGASSSNPYATGSAYQHLQQQDFSAFSPEASVYTTFAQQQQQQIPRKSSMQELLNAPLEDYPSYAAATHGVGNVPSQQPQMGLQDVNNSDHTLYGAAQAAEFGEVDVFESDRAGLLDLI
ncbi:hypothetical protein HKX48_006127 [Thoreauomyces humboldtii]|nr:hypothetical protein HKX48_006127 [Thoreauomyces humboldtii]